MSSDSIDKLINEFKSQYVSKFKSEQERIQERFELNKKIFNLTHGKGIRKKRKNKK